MKRSIKKNSCVYAYLNASGLLENGTGKEIEQAKKQYWKDYKKKWRNEKKMNSKPFKIVVNLKEARIIEMQAKKYHTSPTNYVKQSAITGRNITDLVAVGEVRELIILHHNTLRTLAEENELPKQMSNILIEQISQIEKNILNFFSALK